MEKLLGFLQCNSGALTVIFSGIVTVATIVYAVLTWKLVKETKGMRENQAETSAIEKFQNRYFELIKMHRDNVAEIGIGEDFGRKIFVILIREFREILKITKGISEQTNQTFTPEQLFVVSYCALLYGVGPNSSRIFKEALKGYDKVFVDKLEAGLNNDITKNKVRADRGFRFTPFEGHQSRLGHYYRHLYQAICYVDQQTINIDKYEYVKVIRAQLTTHEQALLFINSLTAIGSVWWEKKLIDTYRLVQNIPLGFFDEQTEIDIVSRFPNDYFEWQERESGTNGVQPMG